MREALYAEFGKIRTRLAALEKELMDARASLAQRDRYIKRLEKKTAEIDTIRGENHKLRTEVREHRRRIRST